MRMCRYPRKYKHNTDQHNCQENVPDYVRETGTWVDLTYGAAISVLRRSPLLELSQR